MSLPVAVAQLKPTLAERADRILFVLADLSAGGAERSTLRLSADLAQAGVETMLFRLRDGGAWCNDLPQQIPTAAALPAQAKPHRHVPTVLRRLLPYARASDAIVGALELEATYFAFLAGAIARRPVIGWVHAVMGEHLRELSPLHTLLAKLIYPRLDGLVFPSQGAADSLAHIAKLDPDRMAVIPSYLDVDRIAALSCEPLPAWAQAIYAKPTVVCIGRLVPSKAVGHSLQAHGLLRARGLDHHLLLLGDGPLRQPLLAQARALGLTASVYLPGFVANPYPFLHAAAAFALASRFEGLSLAVIEALALGVPVVAADSPGGVRDVLDHGRYGVLVARDDAAALANALERVMRNSELSTALRAAGPGRAREYSRQRILPRWQERLREIRFRQGEKSGK